MYTFKVADSEGRQEITILKDGAECSSVSFRSPLVLDDMRACLNALVDQFERSEVPGELTTQEKAIRDGRVSFVAVMTLHKIEEAIKFATPDLEKLLAAEGAGSDLGPVARPSNAITKSLDDDIISLLSPDQKAGDDLGPVAR